MTAPRVLIPGVAVPTVAAMQLTAEQQTLARQWLAEGMKLSDLQKRLESEFGMRLTYMDVRLLVADLQVMPKDPERPATPPSETTKAPGDAPEPASALGGVRVTVDTVTHPGAMVSGKVTFSDGQKATWLVDQYGRPGLAPETKGYRPSKADMQEFQVALEQELVKLGM